MSILVVGGDYLDGIFHDLRALGFKSLQHIQGRKNMAAEQVVIPHRTDVVLVLTDYVNHNLARSIKCKARQKNIPVIFCKRSRVQIDHKIKQLLQQR